MWPYAKFLYKWDKHTALFFTGDIVKHLKSGKFGMITTPRSFETEVELFTMVMADGKTREDHWLQFVRATAEDREKLARDGIF
jgi:hypothetical protein